MTEAEIKAKEAADRLAADKAAQEEFLNKLKLEAKALIDEKWKELEGVDIKSLTGLKEIVETKATKEEVEKLTTLLDTVAGDLKAAQENGKKGERENKLTNDIVEHADKLKALTDRQSGVKTVPMVVKLFETDTSFEPTFEDFLTPDLAPGISRTPDVRERFNVLNIVTTGRAMSKFIEWIEEDTETGTANFIGECVAKPDVSKTWIRNKTIVKKIADYTRICDEVLIYVAFANQEIKRFLEKLVFIGIQEGLMNGDGIGNNLLGIVPQATSFVAGGKAVSVPFANRADAVKAVVSQINCLGYNATHVLMNCEDLFHFEVIKDANGQYLSPSLGGVTIVDCPFITPGDFLVGEMRQVRVNFLQNITLDVGLNGEDFRENATSMRAEAFLASYIPNNQIPAFVSATFAAVIAAINKP